MIDLDVLRLLDILPARITDKEMEALSYALDPELQEITDAITEAIIMPRIDELNEKLVDLLAWQLHVDFYEPLGLDLDVKRKLVKNSLIWHRYKGTKYALESMIRVLFFDDFSVDEWFEYDGRPYFFRIVSNVSFTGSAAELWARHRELFLAIWELKNERSWLDYIMFIKDVDPTPAIIVGLHKHAVNHLHHPGERRISQRHDHDNVPVIPVGIAKHAVKHTTEVRPRDTNQSHEITPIPTIPVGKTVHAVQHMAEPVKNTFADSLMFLEIEGEGIVSGFIDVNGVIKQGFVEIITEGA